MLKATETTSQQDAFGAVCQLGHVVNDIRSEIDAWQSRGVGPWLWMRHVRLPCTFRGEASVPVIDVALSYQGNMQIELIQQLNDAPSPYRSTIEAGSYGLHHQAFLCENIHSDVERAEGLGYEMVCDIRMYGSRYVYLQSPDADKNTYIEFLPASLMMKGMIRRGIAVSKTWSGEGRPMVVDLANPARLIGSIPDVIRAWLSR